MNTIRFALAAAALSSLLSSACGYEQYVLVSYDLPDSERAVANEECVALVGSAATNGERGFTLAFVNEGGTETTPFHQSFIYDASTTRFILADRDDTETILAETTVDTGAIVPGFEAQLTAENDGLTIVATYVGVDAEACGEVDVDGAS